MKYPILSRLATITLFLTLSAGSLAQQSDFNVRVVGEMKNVMWQGQLDGTIDIDTITGKKHLYGLGPEAYLTGELLILDGTCYRSRLLTDSTMKVEKTTNEKAPFFAYAYVDRWQKKPLPASVKTLQQLEEYLRQLARNHPRPFLFLLKGKVAQATIHVVNLPAGTKVSSPDDAHKGRRQFTLRNSYCTMLGFFSTEHKTIFTHHDTFMHLHLITADKQKMGHVDEVLLQKGTIHLYLPVTR